LQLAPGIDDSILMTGAAHVNHQQLFGGSGLSLVRIPQQPVPVGMNLWCFKKKTASSQAVVIQSFQYLAQ
jgi:hypothetical protein